MRWAWALGLMCGAAGFACQRPQIDCAQRSSALRSLSEPNQIQLADPVRSLSPQGTSIVLVAEAATQTLITTVAPDQGTTLATVELGGASALQQVDARTTLAITSSGGLFVIQDGTKATPLLEGREATNPGWTSTASGQLHAIVQEPSRAAEIVSFAPDTRARRVRLQGPGGTPFGGIANNSTTLCFYELSDTGSDYEIRCLSEGKNDRLAIGADATPRISRDGVSTLAMTESEIFWIGSDGMVHRRPLSGESSAVTVSGVVGAQWLRQSECGVLVRAASGAAAQLSYFFQDEVIPLLDEKFSDAQLGENVMTYLVDRTPFYRRF